MEKQLFSVFPKKRRLESVNIPKGQSAEKDTFPRWFCCAIEKRADIPTSAKCQEKGLFSTILQAAFWNTGGFVQTARKHNLFLRVRKLGKCIFAGVYVKRLEKLFLMLDGVMSKFLLSDCRKILSHACLYFSRQF